MEKYQRKVWQLIDPQKAKSLSMILSFIFSGGYTMSNLNNAPSIFIPHGAGPMPLLGDSGHQEMVELLEKLPSTFEKPDAIVLISAHWETDVITITGNDSPELIYDYYGFPEEAYQIQYPALGAPKLASKIEALLKTQGIDAHIDNKRGFDHGMYVPLKLMYPNAGIPCVQISLSNTLNPKLHIELGKAIAELRSENVLILGSGFSFHNMQAFKGNEIKDDKNVAFESWLIETCTSKQTSLAQKEQSLINWHEAPYAKYCHPREEHLLPLLVCFGAGMDNAQIIFNGNIIGKKASAYQW